MLQDFKEFSEKLAIRDDLRIAKVTKKDLVQEYREERGKEWFGEFSSNSLVLFKKMRDEKPPKTLFYDLSTETSPVYDWINQESLEPFDELSGGSYKIGDLIKKPMFLAFLDRTHPKYGAESIVLYSHLTQIAPEYPQFIFMFSESSQNEAKKRYLGITWKEEPALALNYIRSKGSIVFPRKRKFTLENIREFLNAYIRGELEQVSTGLNTWQGEQGKFRNNLF